jgi:hypothetical protein
MGLQTFPGMIRRIPISPCRHCGKPPGLRVRRRGLCNSCYANPAIRRLYPAKAVGSAGPGIGQEFAGPAKLPRRPTDAALGSLAKLPVLAARAAQCRQLFHPADVVMPPDAWGWKMTRAEVPSGRLMQLQGTA